MNPVLDSSFLHVGGATWKLVITNFFVLPLPPYKNNNKDLPCKHGHCSCPHW